LEELGIPELTSQQIEELCLLTEKSARQYVLSKVSSREVEKLDISVEAEGSKPVTLSVDVDLLVTRQSKVVDARKLAREAVKQSLSVAEGYLKGLKCRSQM
jgi:hypothetical protein